VNELKTVINNPHVLRFFSFFLQNLVLLLNPLKHVVTMKCFRSVHLGYVFRMVLRIDVDISLYTLNRLVFLTETVCVPCEVGTQDELRLHRLKNSTDYIIIYPSTSKFDI
jgi:hypothetical protein